MKVTVIITVYNMVKYLESTIQSALRQAPAADEILVIDDGSTDGSSEILARYSHALRVIRNPTNRGVFLSTLRGIKASTGDILCFLDADDLWAPNKVGAVRSVFERDATLVLVSHDYRFMKANGTTLREDDPSQDEMRRLLSRGQDELLSQKMRESILQYQGHVWLGSGYSIRRSALDSPKLQQWIETLPQPEYLYQDHPLATFLVLTTSGRFGYIDQKLLSYRVHNESYSSGASSVDRALKILHKGEMTHRATLELVQHHRPDLTEVLRVQKVKLNDYLYLRSVYERNVSAAVRLFTHHVCQTENRSQWLKEALRVVTCLSLGATTFFSVKSKVGMALAASAGK